MTETWTEEGMAPWLRSRVAATAREVASEWGVELGPPFALSRFALAAPAGDDEVLKVTPAEDDEGDHEADALELWDGEGAVRVLRRDRARRAMLLARARPGDDASELPDEEATRAAVEVGLKLWRPAGAPFRWIGDHVPRWLDNTEREGREGVELMPLARELYAELAPRRDTLVHGDFHHHNLLRDGDRWLAIDPKPYLGEPEFDVPSFLWNPIPYRMTPELTERRIAAFVAAGLDDFRIRAWTAIRGAYLGADADEARVIRGLF